MRHYVKVSKGVIVDGPNELPSSESSSPNSNWGKEQMKLNGFFEVDLTCDRDKESIDYENPDITEDSVTYNKTQLDSTTHLSNVKSRLIKQAKGELESRVSNRFSMVEMILVSLNLTNNAGMLSDIQRLIDALTTYRSAVNSSSNVQEAKSHTVNWPNL